jgi:NhaB family Na+:H+ antiporter
MVAGIYFIKDVLFIIFTKLFLSIKKKHFLSLTFCVICACLAAFLGLITLAAISIAVGFNFYSIYRKASNDGEGHEEDFEEFRGFLRNLIIHGAIGATIGGTMTIVGEPQNLMIATKMGWGFVDFFKHNHVIALPVAVVAFIVCFLLEFFRFPGFGHRMPDRVRRLIIKDYRKKINEMTIQNVYIYAVQIIGGILLVFSLAFSVAQVGLVGIGLIVLVTAFTGVTEEHDLAGAFNNAMPFTMLIITFFVILGVVHEQHLISPLAEWVFTFKGKTQLIALYFVNGTLSFVSDNVFVAAVFISEVDKAYAAGLFSQEWYEKLAVVVNMGTNIPAIATPNGQAGFLFILTSSLSPLIGLSYFKMLKLVLPYTIAMTGTGALVAYFIL